MEDPDDNANQIKAERFSKLQKLATKYCFQSFIIIALFLSDTDYSFNKDGEPQIWFT
jgi:hypothetical protein